MKKKTPVTPGRQFAQHAKSLGFAVNQAYNGVIAVYKEDDAEFVRLAVLHESPNKIRVDYTLSGKVVSCDSVLVKRFLSVGEEQMAAILKQVKYASRAYEIVARRLHEIPNEHAVEIANILKGKK